MFFSIQSFFLTAFSLLTFSAFAQTVNDDCLQWANQTGSPTMTDTGNAMAVDAAGNVYTTGFFSGTADFDPGNGAFTLTALGEIDAYVCKFDAKGQFLWAQQMGGSRSDIGHAIAVDGAGNVYTAGTFTGIADFDPGADVFELQPTGSSSLFLSKLDTAGNFVWGRQIAGGATPTALKLDKLGNLYMAGYFQGTADFDPADTVALNLTSASWESIFVLKLNAGGQLVWARHMENEVSVITLNNRANGLGVDAAGNVYTAGNFQGTVDFDPGAGVFQLKSLGLRDIFVSKLDSAGTFVWTKRVGQAFGTNTWANGLALDRGGNVHVTGHFTNLTDFDPGPGVFNLKSAGTDVFATDAFVLKLDAAGNFVWARQMGGKSNEDGKAIAIDDTGNIYTIGYFFDQADFDPGPGVFNLTGAASNMYLSKLDTLGRFIWAKSILSPNVIIPAAMVVDTAACLYAMGHFSGTADFDPGAGMKPLTAPSRDIFVNKLCPCTLVDAEEPLSSASGHLQAHPNPFQSSTTIDYEIPLSTAVHLAVYDLLGQTIAVLVDGPQTAGRHTVTFSAAQLPAGTYFYGIQAGGIREARKLVLVE